MTTGNIDHLTTAKSPLISGLRPEEFQFSQASVTGAGVSADNPRRADIMGALEQIVGANGIAAHALGFGATAAAATALLASGVSPAIAGTAALTGVVASVLSPSKGSGRG